MDLTALHVKLTSLDPIFIVVIIIEICQKQVDLSRIIQKLKTIY
ncbi:uncharacterized protein METZ01_LOCUS272316 [marine metagenome]|uniref:Uncharacterized protein n=1 Tax=marine metagenome TaxID=408172 RepID=A0A382K7U9_9ZZZZ